MKTSTQLKALVRNISNQNNIQAEIILRNFMMERFLERVSLSKYKENFILKGGMLISALVGIATRTTMDIDATIKGEALDSVSVKAMIDDILNIEIEDNTQFTFQNIQTIHEESDYPCFRVSLMATFDKTRQVMKVDITTGDFITPKEIDYAFKLMFEDRKIDIFTYNIETVLAEKIQTIISRNILNTRMRDFYDVYILSVTQNINFPILNRALNITCQNRGTSNIMTESDKIITEISTDKNMSDLWKRYQSQFSYAENITWDMTIESLQELILRIYS